jgi:hypothetical protein
MVLLEPVRAMVWSQQDKGVAKLQDYSATPPIAADTAMGRP